MIGGFGDASQRVVSSTLSIGAASATLHSVTYLATTTTRHKVKLWLTSTQPPKCKLSLIFVKSLSVNTLANEGPAFPSAGVTNLLSAFWRLPAFDLANRTYRRGLARQRERWGLDTDTRPVSRCSACVLFDWQR